VALRIAGYAALFGVTDGAGDTIRPGAFAKALAEGGELPLFWQHD
jgi:HK97 family phage prohead protease